MSLRNRHPRLFFTLLTLACAIAAFYVCAGLAGSFLPPSALYQSIFVSALFPSATTLLASLSQRHLATPTLLRILFLCLLTVIALILSIHQAWVTPIEGLILSCLLLSLGFALIAPRG